MTKSLLIVTADTKFAQVLLHGLEQEGYQRLDYQRKGRDSRSRGREKLILAFLDMDLGYRAVLEIGKALRVLNPEIRLVCFLTKGHPPSLDEIHPWMLSPKPYLFTGCVEHAKQ